MPDLLLRGHLCSERGSCGLSSAWSLDLFWECLDRAWSVSFRYAVVSSAAMYSRYVLSLSYLGHMHRRPTCQLPALTPIERHTAADTTSHPMLVDGDADRATVVHQVVRADDGDGDRYDGSVCHDDSDADARPQDNGAQPDRRYPQHRRLPGTPPGCDDDGDDPWRKTARRTKIPPPRPLPQDVVSTGDGLTATAGPRQSRTLEDQLARATTATATAGDSTAGTPTDQSSRAFRSPQMPRVRGRFISRGFEKDGCVVCHLSARGRRATT